MPLPPGTILQLMYLENRLNQLQPGKFIEIGPGAGDITALLLRLGWTGTSIDLEASTIARLEQRFSAQVATGQLTCMCGNFLQQNANNSVDLVISCMVMEHLDEAAQTSYWSSAATSLRESGIMISLVPASQAHWGIEDDIAGHYRRYDRAQLRALARDNGYAILHVASLTYPLSNLLLPVSNFLVRRSESRKLNLSMDERTKLSGKREVNLKTRFPDIFKIVLNRFTLYPFYLLQRLSSNSERALVLYVEAQPDNKRNAPA